MKEILIASAVFLGCFFALPTIFPALDGVLFHIGTIGVRYFHLITAGMVAMTVKAVS